MNNQAYYRILDGTDCDLAISERPLIVNCSGACVLSEPFTTHNRRGRSDYYLLYLYQGELTIDLPDARQTVCAGNMVIFPPGHAYRYTKRGHDQMIYYWAHFSGAMAGELLQRCQLPALRVQFVGVNTDVSNAFHELFQNFISRDDYSEVAAASVLANICVLLRRKICGTVTSSAKDPAERIQKSLSYMHLHYRDAISVPMLADIEHLSTSRYSAIFRQCIGMAPRDFLIDLRLKMAVELMRGTDLSLKQVAKNVGYEDQLYFSRLFKSKMGLSPIRYLSYSKSKDSDRIF